MEDIKERAKLAAIEAREAAEHFAAVAVILESAPDPTEAMLFDAYEKTAQGMTAAAWAKRHIADARTDREDAINKRIRTANTGE